ncbi:hypothetical protein [Streptomyces sp. NPDC050535]|uniref:hypothetical protein n=1 Tax=Streptomyces sp. NPDC050535 TaxID=3365626 RepID=UPI0037986DCD
MNITGVLEPGTGARRGLGRAISPALLSRGARSEAGSRQEVPAAGVTRQFGAVPTGGLNHGN